MKLDSKYFDRVRVKPGPIQRKTLPPCEWQGCAAPGTHKAPKGRDLAGEYHTFCLSHVQEYNKTYNFFAGMQDDAVSRWQKDAITGHRPTWKFSQNPSTAPAAKRGLNGRTRDPHGLFGTRAKTPERPARPVHNAELKALHTLGLDETATPQKTKQQYKTLVKRLHPDANGGSRSNEDTLQRVIQAYDYLRSTGFC